MVIGLILNITKKRVGTWNATNSQKDCLKMGDIPIIHPVHDHDFARIDKTMYLWYFDMFDPSTYQPPIIHLSSTNYDMSYHSIDVREKNPRHQCMFIVQYGVYLHGFHLNDRSELHNLPHQIISHGIMVSPYRFQNYNITYMSSVLPTILGVSLYIIIYIYLCIHVGGKVGNPILRAKSRYVPRQTWHGALVVRKDETSWRPELSPEKPCWLMKL